MIWWRLWTAVQAEFIGNPLAMAAACDGKHLRDHKHELSAPES